jgi:hypothetical protein
VSARNAIRKATSTLPLSPSNVTGIQDNRLDEPHHAREGGEDVVTPVQSSVNRVDDERIDVFALRAPIDEVLQAPVLKAAM